MIQKLRTTHNFIINWSLDPNTVLYITKNKTKKCWYHIITTRNSIRLISSSHKYKSIYVELIYSIPTLSKLIIFTPKSLRAEVHPLASTIILQSVSSSQLAFTTLYIGDNNRKFHKLRYYLFLTEIWSIQPQHFPSFIIEIERYWKQHKNEKCAWNTYCNNVIAP